MWKLHRNFNNINVRTFILYSAPSLRNGAVKNGRPTCSKEEIRKQGVQQETQLSLSQRDGLIATSDMHERSLQTSTFENWKVTVPGDFVLNRFKAHLWLFFAPAFASVVIAAATGPSSPPPPPGTSGSGTIEIAIGDTVVRVVGQVETSVLIHVLRAVRRSS